MKELLTLNNFKKPKLLINHIVLKFSYLLRLNHVPVLPTTLDIEPNNWCNFECDHCQVTHWNKPKSALTLESFTQIIQQFPNLLLVKVQGMGEPFLNKSTIAMLEKLDSKGIEATTISNGSVLTEKLIERLSKLKYISIAFSMDGATKNTFEGIRIKGNFDKVVANIKKLTKYCPNMNVSFWIVVTDKNYMECEETINIARETGVQNITFQTYLSNWGKDEMNKKISDIKSEKSKVNKHINLAVKEGYSKDVQVHRYDGDYMTKAKPCQWPWTSMYIDASGNVVPCCVLADSDTMNLGNVFEEDVKNIWNSKKYISFRKQHATGDIPDVCKACYQMEETS